MSEHDDLDGVPRLGDAELTALLVDPSIWDEPPAGLEARVISAVADAQSPSRLPAAAGRARRRWFSPAVAAVLGAAAAALIAVAAWPDRSGGEPTAEPAAHVAMSGTDLAPGADGTAGVRKLGSGWAIEIAIADLPWRDGDAFYQVWVRDCAMKYLVPAGSFHDLKHVVAWAGVSLDEFPVITVTREQLTGNDDGQKSSGEVVARGTLHPCP